MEILMQIFDSYGIKPEELVFYIASPQGKIDYPISPWN